VSIVTDRYHNDWSGRLKDELEEPEQAKALLKQAMLQTNMFESRLVKNPLELLYASKKIDTTSLINSYIALPIKSDFKNTLINTATKGSADLNTDEKLQLLIMQEALPVLRLSKDPSNSLPEIFGKSTKNVINNISVLSNNQESSLAAKV
jgi:hypothetical protein